MCEMGDTGELDLEHTCNGSPGFHRLLEGACFGLFLHIGSCYALSRLPESLGQLLVALATPILSVCRWSRKLPAWLERHTTWASLGLPSYIRALPGFVTKLATALTLIECLELTGLVSMGQMTPSMILDLSGCRVLTWLPSSLSSQGDEKINHRGDADECKF